MKKLLGLLLSGVAIVALSGCGTTDGDGDNGGGNPGVITSVDIYNLEQGYRISGVNVDDDDIDVLYCGNNYDLYTGSDHFTGTFNIGDEGYRINMFDDDGGSYRVDTSNGNLEVDEYYQIKYIDDYIIVESITEISC